MGATKTAKAAKPAKSRGKDKRPTRPAKQRRPLYTPEDRLRVIPVVGGDGNPPEPYRTCWRRDEEVLEWVALFIAHFRNLEQKLMSSGYLRSGFTSDLVGQFISGVHVDANEEIPALSRVELNPKVLERVEVLKHFTFCSLIMSPRLKVAE